MMKLSPIVRRDSLFYPVLFIAWGLILYGVNARYSSFGSPFPGVDLGGPQSAGAVAQAMADTISHERNALSSEKNTVKRGRILEAIGTTFFRMYGVTRKRAFLDSAFAASTNALRENAKSSAAYFMLGQIMAEKKEFASARDQYEKAIACGGPRSALLQQTLGILYWFDLKRSDLAKPCFEKALAIDSSFPTVHYVLGVMSLEKNDAAAAMDHFEHELRIFNALSTYHGPSPVDQADVRMAACFSSLRLAFLYSTSSLDERKAQDRFGMYMKLENDPQRRQASANQFQKYWKTGQSR
jgi:tetratricopeptide (TPR) repeat protein